MKAKRPTVVRGTDGARRKQRQPARGTQRRSPDAPPRRGRPRPTDTAPVVRPQIKPVRPKNASQAKARAKARKAKAPKVVRPSFRERIITRISAIDLNPRTLAARVPFVVLVIGSLGLGLGVTLWLSTDAAERSYQLGSARETNQALLQQKEALERDVLEAQAAPALAESARDLGMIPSRDTAHLVQDPSGNWIVVGTPKPAEGVPPPPLNAPLPDDTPAPTPQAAASRPALPVVDPREVVVRMPGRGDPAVPPPVAPTAPEQTASPLTVPLPDAPHGTGGQPPALGPADPLAEPLAVPQQALPQQAAPLPGPPQQAAPQPGPPQLAMPGAPEQFGPVSATTPGPPA
jgi:hypothetical protein